MWCETRASECKREIDRETERDLEGQRERVFVR